MYSNCCCSCSFEREIITIGQSSHNMYSNSIVNFQESTTILNACTQKSGNLLKAPRNSQHRGPNSVFCECWLFQFQVDKRYHIGTKWKVVKLHTKCTLYRYTPNVRFYNHVLERVDVCIATS